MTWAPQRVAFSKRTISLLLDTIKMKRINLKPIKGHVFIGPLHGPYLHGTNPKTIVRMLACVFGYGLGVFAMYVCGKTPIHEIEKKIKVNACI